MNKILFFLVFTFIYINSTLSQTSLILTNTKNGKVVTIPEGRALVYIKHDQSILSFKKGRLVKTENESIILQRQFMDDTTSIGIDQIKMIGYRNIWTASLNTLIGLSLAETGGIIFLMFRGSTFRCINITKGKWTLSVKE